ncbi:MAG: tetratricopeptide repeat protein, partial [Limisphaerales bacterium]
NPAERVRLALKTLTQHGLLRRAESDHWQFTHVLGYRFARDEDDSDPALRRRLGCWLHAHLMAALKASAGGETVPPMNLASGQVVQHSPPRGTRGERDRERGNLEAQRLLSLALLPPASGREGVRDLHGSGAPIAAFGSWSLSLARPLQHAAALLRADHDQRLWLPLANYVLYDARDRLVDLGRLELVNLALRAFEDWMQRFPPGKAAEPAWQRERSAMLDRQGDVLSAQGDLAGALQAYRASLTVSQRLASADPSNAGWQRDLSVSQERVGDVLMAQGDLAGALQAYREALTVTQRLASADPSNAAWQRDLSLSQTLIGQVLMKQEQWREALPHLEQSLLIDERIAARDPTNVTWQKDVQVSRRLVAEVRARL